jgi:hypothetical protein
MLWVFLSLGAGGTAAAQEAFVAGSAGVCTGAGTSASFSVSSGYLLSKRFGFEVEFGVTPDVERDVDLPTIGPLANIPPAFASLFPRVMVNRSGTLYSFHTNVMVPLADRPRLQISAVAGGGVATLSERTHVHLDAFDLPAIPGLPDIPGLLEIPGLRAISGSPRLAIPAIDTTREQSHTGLSLTAGGIVDVPVARHLAIGADVRYQHVFLSDVALNLTRISGRVRWRF